MANEIVADYTTGLTLYFHRYLANGNIFLTDAGTNEQYGTSGDADFYDAPMVEEAAGSGHYIGSFASGGTAIAAGSYQIQIRLQAGVNPANSPTDIIIYKGQMEWDGTAEINQSTITTIITAILVDTGTTLNDILNRILKSLGLHR